MGPQKKFNLGTFVKQCNIVFSCGFAHKMHPLFHNKNKTTPQIQPVYAF